jgi:hypothetical protein
MAMTVQFIKKAWDWLVDLVEGEDGPDEIIYDPVHIAGVIVGSLCAMGMLFWLLWALLVCEGGLFVKVIPFFRVVFTSKTLHDFGYEGYPYELGIFEGWIVNLVAFVLTIALLIGIWWVFQPKKEKPS